MGDHEISLQREFVVRWWVLCAVDEQPDARTSPVQPRFGSGEKITGCTLVIGDYDPGIDPSSPWKKLTERRERSGAGRGLIGDCWSRTVVSSHDYRTLGSAFDPGASRSG